MEHRQFGRSGLQVPVLSFGTGTFGGTNEFFQRWGQSDVAEATRLVDVCLDAGLTFFDTADVYSDGASEEILGRALKGRRHQALISSKATFPMGPGAQRARVVAPPPRARVRGEPARLGTDHIDVYFMHGFDALTPVEETLRALDDLVRAGKIGYIGASNFSGWHLMKALATSERYGLARYVAYQGYYSLVGRHYEWELMPLGSTRAWRSWCGARSAGGASPARSAAASRPPPGASPRGATWAGRRWATSTCSAWSTCWTPWRPRRRRPWRRSRSTGCSRGRRSPTSSIGARDEAQLRQNLGALGWSLSADQIARLDRASHETPVYPYWHQRGFADRNPKPTEW
jgi:aryl-alcohol dehydrogenase-like predicted oxidoreductase